MCWICFRHVLDSWRHCIDHVAPMLGHIRFLRLTSRRLVTFASSLAFPNDLLIRRQFANDSWNHVSGSQICSVHGGIEHLPCVCVFVCVCMCLCVCVCSGVGCESWKHVTDSHNIPARKLLASRTPPPCICSSAYVAVDVGSPTLFFEQFCVTCLILGVSWMGTQGCKMGSQIDQARCPKQTGRQ